MVFLSSSLFSRAVAGLKNMVKESANPMRGLLPGTNPIIRTTQYLEQGIVLRDSIRIMMINYSDSLQNENLHEGARKLVSLNFSQFQYKNPNVQIVCLKNLTPTPFITFYLENGEKFYVDIEGRTQVEILLHLQKVVGKPRELIEQQTKAVEPNPANFGNNYQRKCICECEGQVECSSKLHIISGDLIPKVRGRSLNMNPKKYPFGIEEED